MYDIFSFKTRDSTGMYDITRQIDPIINKSGIQNGVCIAYVPHTTCGITINENADPAVPADILKSINKLVPFDDSYSHAEGNSAAHIKASLFGSSVNIIIEKGALVLGTWQSVFLCEFDGPRTRKICVKIISEV